MTTALIVAVTVNLDRARPDPAAHAHAVAALAVLVRVPTVPRRPDRDDYERGAFGVAWTDAVSVRGGHNGCDTRNDILRRDLSDVTVGPVRSCPSAILSGEFRSPYTGDTVVFRRDRGATAAQIDHIVPLALSWDMGAWSWPAERRADFANDPANLVAVDGESNQAKSDAEPAVWMPPLTAFHCRYAVQFVEVVAGYGLSIEMASRKVLADVLESC
ncbi:HNH endonuclease family protein [Gordonia sp. DT219]|uniref:HNH endonuclease family protein n=1 Tax=Gordonia sp. DT219 TaxID=3416658 RepID=UPI003CF29A50